MSHKFREDLVGKRFLSICGSVNQCSENKLPWRAGVIRAATHNECTNKELQVLVEYDGVDWQRREWLSVYTQNTFKYFLVEKNLCWAPRKYKGENIKWPALTLTSLVSQRELSPTSQPIEYLHDNVLAFVDYNNLEPFLDWDNKKFPSLPADVQLACKAWRSQQDGQRILTTTPSVLGGCRTQVYRVVGTTQWYTAVIVGYSETTGELTVTDDTVLEEHSVDPSLVQMQLLGDVVDSIMRGEVLGVMPRRSRSSLQVNSNNRDKSSVNQTNNIRKRTIKNNVNIILSYNNSAQQDNNIISNTTTSSDTNATTIITENNRDPAVKEITEDKEESPTGVGGVTAKSPSAVKRSPWSGVGAVGGAGVVASEEDDCVIVCARDAGGDEDSGVSGLRSGGSGDERSGSRSSALSDEGVWSVAAAAARMAHPYQPGAAPPPPLLHLPPPTAPYMGPRYAHHNIPDELERVYTHERLIRERNEQEHRDLIEKQQKEKERADREERERREEKDIPPAKLVQKHFEQSLLLNSQKFGPRTNSWSLINSLTPPSNRDHERVLNDRLRQNERSYYPPASTPSHQQVQRPPSAPAKADYPPPAHHRLAVPQKQSDKPPTIHTTLPKAEPPNFNPYSYNYRTPYDKLKVMEPMKHSHIETKNSVIVKHDAKPQLHIETKYQQSKQLVTPTRQDYNRGYRVAQAPPPPPQNRYQPAAAAYYYPQPPTTTRPKVSSPAPPHMYGKPAPADVSSPPVPYPPPYSPAHRGHVPPPPAHCRTPSPRPPPRAHGPEPTQATVAPCQLQPLDLGRRRLSETVPEAPEAPEETKRRRLDDDIPEVVEAAPAEPAASPAPAAPPVAASPVPARGPEPSPEPPPPVQASHPHRHLKKAWLQRHETAPPGDEDSSAGGGGGVCVTLPMTISPPPPPVNTPVLSPAKSFNRIGTMAVNSIGRTKTPKPRKTKDTDSRSEDARADSSSSEREADAPPKRKPPKTKRRKAGNARKAADEPKKKKSSESGSESDKESDGDKDSDSGGGSRRGNGRSRGRRPRGGSGSGGNGGKRRDEPPAKKQATSARRTTTESFLQNGACVDVAPHLSKCRECRCTPTEKDTNASIFCRFYAFRRLRMVKGQLTIAGFSDPYKDCDTDNEKLWSEASNGSSSAELDIEMSCFLLREIGDHFCELLQQEKEAETLNVNEDKTILWKRVVQGVREMCDVCETTLFNLHWTCSKCGFVVCIDCYKARTSKEEKLDIVETESDTEETRDAGGWLTCAEGNDPHAARHLALTQIAAGDCLMRLQRGVHNARAVWGLPECTVCENKADGVTRDSRDVERARRLLKTAISQNQSHENGESKENGSTIQNGNTGSSLSWLEAEASGSDGTSSSSDEGSTLRTLLGGEAGKEEQSNKRKRRDTLSAVLRAGAGAAGGRYSARAPRIMTLAESRLLYPKTPHAWLADGRLLHLTDAHHPSNYRAFQDQWKRGQPVLVSDVLKHLNPDLWTPESFSRDFGDRRVDLINCASGLVVPNQLASRFWDGFDTVASRLRDERKAPMVLKIKDWPPAEDFAETLPERFDDLMRGLPLREYTARNGRLNLAARLPDCLVKPDLGPKLYTAYGGAGGTTNLHLDVSDAVNVLVHASAPRDAPERAREARRAVDESGADDASRRRARAPAALWHIYAARDADKIRDLLARVQLERGARPEKDPVHDQTWYLDAALRDRLYRDYGVEGYTVLQCAGDAVFIPAGAPHQVRNLLDCIKVAEDFVSPENVARCFELSRQFRTLSARHSNREDKLQIKNIVYHAVKDSLCRLRDALH